MRYLPKNETSKDTKKDEDRVTIKMVIKTDVSIDGVTNLGRPLL